MKCYVVWNQNKTEGFITKDKQLAYEVRKGSETNCYDSDGVHSSVGETFCYRWGHENCSIEEINL